MGESLLTDFIIRHLRLQCITLETAAQVCPLFSRSNVSSGCASRCSLPAPRHPHFDLSCSYAYSPYSSPQPSLLMAGTQTRSLRERQSLPILSTRGYGRTSSS